MLGRLDRFWELARQGHGGEKLPVKLPMLKRAQESAAAEVGKIVTAQIIWEIYFEAWTLYATAMDLEGPDNGSTMPPELPCWMKARKNFVPPDDGWSEYVFGHLFGRAKESAWNGRSHFLQVYRIFKSLWTPISRREIQQLERAVHQDWVRLMDPAIEARSRVVRVAQRSP
ncbi:hypothetical protein PCL_09481 [Purpureocillium lilacinum]|uniref:Uncharacterized protein n=1 Tax=Purpureocillium lilacinum TaxID=33203 RepID=A0A2U3DQV7_PURLI|nr:hypothetical protein PCL_09481 [Purpureocillium lilacinum]